MSEEQEKLLIDEEETIQIKDLNRVNEVKNTDLLLLDDGVSSSKAITYENFLKTTKDKTFKGEGLSYFKEIIKSTIAEELAGNTSFIEKIYTQIIEKLINNDSTNISNLFSKIKSELTNSILTSTLTEHDELLIMYSSKIIQKHPFLNNCLECHQIFPLEAVIMVFGFILRTTQIKKNNWNGRLWRNQYCFSQKYWQ